MIDLEFQIHTVSVETYTGPGPTGDTWAAPVTAQGVYAGGLTTVKEAGGDELDEASSFYGSIEDADKFTPRSKVTYLGRVSYVREVFIHDGGAAGTFDDVEHIQVVLV